MPAKSKSQQRLFGMVHAYNKGELHAPSSLRKRIASLSKRISDEDARHFAQTPHSGLPDKTAQVVLLPEDVKKLYGQIPPGVYLDAVTPRSEKRRSFLGHVLRGTVAGAAVGGLGMGSLGLYLANKAVQGTPGLDPVSAQAQLAGAGLNMGLWGAGRGAIAGALTGIGIGILDKLRG